MQVFKLYLNIIRKNVPVLSMYVLVFLVVSMLMSTNLNQELQKMTSFKQAKSDIVFISEEKSPLIDGFRKELAKYGNFVDLPDKTEDLQDALFFRTASYILRIPEGFTEGFMKGEDVKTEKTVVPDSYSSFYIDLCIDKYFNTAKLYVRNIEGITQEELVRYLESDLEQNAKTDIRQNDNKAENHSDANTFFNLFSYSLFSVIVLGMSAMMMVFNNRNLKIRNACSPISMTRMNLQFVLANLIFTFASWLFMVLLCLLVNLKNSLKPNMIYFMLNSFLFAFCCASISYFLGNLIKSDNALAGACNALALGLSFISGAFVPQELLDSSVLKIASFTPNYWFIRANNAIGELTVFDFSHLKPVLSDMLVLICFNMAFFSVALVIGKKNRFA